MVESFQKKILGGKKLIVTREHVQKAITEISERLQDRGTANVISELFYEDPKLHAVDFFLKAIQKFKVSKVSPSESTKAGQGIASHAKEMNVLFGVAVRAVEAALVDILKDTPVVYANNRPEEDFGKFFAQVFRPPKRGTNPYIFLEGDGEEFDCSQGKVTHYVEMFIFLMAGFPKSAVDFWFAHKAFRIFYSKLGFSMVVNLKKDSGYADTLFGNTMWTAMCVAYCVEWTELYILLLKGDDNGIHGEGLKLNKERIAELESIGCKWKFAFTQVLSFCNFFYTAVGALPDVLQRMTKLLSRKFFTIQEAIAYHTSMADQISNIDTTVKYEASILCMSQYYKLPYNECKLLTDNFFTLVNEGPDVFAKRLVRDNYFSSTRDGY
jgi:hypothetical protein